MTYVTKKKLNGLSAEKNVPAQTLEQGLEGYILLREVTGNYLLSKCGQGFRFVEKDIDI